MDCPIFAACQVDEDMFNYAIKELQWQAATYAGSSVHPSPVEGVYLLPPKTVAEELTGAIGDGQGGDNDDDHHNNNDNNAANAADTPSSATTASAAVDAAPTTQPASPSLASPPASSPTTSNPLSVLLSVVQRMEDVPASEVDYHPGSGRQVVDLVHPSLHCLVYGRTRVVARTEAKTGAESEGRTRVVARTEAKTGAESEGSKGEGVNKNDHAGSKPSSSVSVNQGDSSAGTSKCVGEEDTGKGLGFSWREVAGKVGKGVPAVAPDVQNRAWGHSWVSRRFQWLPSEVDVAADGSTATFRSYVNNLHPALFPDAYAAMGDIFARCFVPLFNAVLTDLANPREPRVQAKPYGWYDAWEKANGYTAERLDGLYEDDAAWEWYNSNKQPEQPAVPDFEAPSAAQHVVDLRGRRVQVIVKVASIRLEPGEGEYKGGVWHIEGMKNESIVVSSSFAGEKRM